MSQAPLFENRPCQGRNGARWFQCTVFHRVVQQPLFERFRIRILLNRALQKRALDGQPDAVGGLIALAFAPLSFRGFKGGEQGLANCGGPESLRWILAGCPCPAQESLTTRGA